MIDSKDKLRKCTEIEKKLYYPMGGHVWPFAVREKDVLFGYILNLRKAEYHTNKRHRIRAAIYRLKLLRMSNLYGIHIGLNVCDEGLSLAHTGPIIIHGDSHIGKNLRINVGVNIGANGGKPPVLGDNVYIGPGAKIFGDIQIASGCRIGANAVVNKSCLVENSTLVGIPAHRV